MDTTTGELTVLVADDLGEPDVEDLLDWVARRVHEFGEIGPERDGWCGPSDDGRRYWLWCRRVAIDPTLALMG